MNHALLPRTANANLPATYEAAKFALAECHRLDECKDWSDKAQALASYARQSEDKELEATAMRIRARAVRRCGELLKEIEKAQPGPKQLGADTGTQLSPRKEAAESAGLSKKQAVTAIRVANIPNEIFVEQVESEKPPTITKLAEQGTKPAKAPPVPHYELLGMTKENFQAGMYFSGDTQRYAEATRRFSAGSVVAGLTPDDREKIRANIATIDAYHDQIISKL